MDLEAKQSKKKCIFQKVKQLQPKIREALKDTILENFRRGGFYRIYPSFNSNVYDEFFMPSCKQDPRAQQSPSSRHINLEIFKLLYSEELLSYNNPNVLSQYKLTLSRHQMLPLNLKKEIQDHGDPTQERSALSLNLVNQRPNQLTKGKYQSVEKQSKQKLLPMIQQQKATGNYYMNIQSNQNQTTPFDHLYVKKGRTSSAVTPKSLMNVKKEKLLITGDDILIEYANRLMIAVKSIKENMLKAQWIYQIEKFIKHSVWHGSDMRRAQNNQLWQRLESRLIEMKERRRRLLQSHYKKELKNL